MAGLLGPGTASRDFMRAAVSEHQCPVKGSPLPPQRMHPLSALESGPGACGERGKLLERWWSPVSTSWDMNAHRTGSFGVAPVSTRRAPGRV